MEEERRSEVGKYYWQELFLGKLTIVFSCAPTELTITIGIQDHGLKIGIWVL